MGEVRYIVSEIFVSKSPSIREENLQKLITEYLRAIEKQISQNDVLG